MKGTRITAIASATALTLAVAFLLGGKPSSDRPVGSPGVAVVGPGGASDLSLAPDLSFTDDSSASFPIRGENFPDGRIASDRPTASFSGPPTAGIPTARRSVSSRSIGSIATRPASSSSTSTTSRRTSRSSLTVFCRGYIPTLTFLDAKRGVVYNRAGETARERGDYSGLEKILRQALGR